MKSNRKEIKQAKVSKPAAKVRESKGIAANKRAGVSNTLSVSFIYCLVRIAKHLRETMDQKLGPLGLQAPQLGILFLLNEHGPMSQTEIGSNFSIDRASMVKLIDALEAKRFVARKADPGDRRANRIELTRSGQEVMAKAILIEREVERTMLARLTATEAKAIKAMLPKLLP